MKQGVRTADGLVGVQHAPVDVTVLEALAGAIGSLRFGTVLVTVHDGKVVQLDTTERRRFS